MAAPTQSDIDEIDKFLASPKALFESSPQWRESNFHKGDIPEREAIWPICNDLRIVGKGRFRFVARDWARKNFSISLVYDGNAIARLDMEDPDVRKPNPTWAGSLGLPSTIQGSHVHSWQNNREFTLSTGNWGLPCREALPPQVRTLKQAFAHFAKYANVEMTDEGRDFDLPWTML